MTFMEGLLSPGANVPEKSLFDVFQVIGFSSESVAAFIGVVGILSILAQVRSNFCVGLSSLL